ncbi:hypothetical protein MKW94_004117 [Papaver nudicaule]|uniref:Uncharacterized protein n=1 Tax=Papaver nudicaule TaxID=74823 RepID=A0AA42ARK5_PAPNU|nr:hypothetical protein [Papaver nudicaule]
MVFSGTTVVNGNCICLVTQIGMNTEIDETSLKKKLNEFGEALTAIIGVICVLVWLINLKYFFTWEYVNGWPANFKFSFEKWTLPRVETLGCTTVICSNKTGTLTTNQMAVSTLVAVGARTERVWTFKFDGTTYSPLEGKINDWPAGRLDSNLQTIAKIAAVCNDAFVTQSGSQYIANGMPTEAALKLLTCLFLCFRLPERLDRSSSSSDVLSCCKRWAVVKRCIATLEFDRDRKSVGVTVKSSSGKNTPLVKGAVENLLERSNYIQLLDGSVDPPQKEVHQAIEDCRAAGIRVMVITGDNLSTAEAICREIGVFGQYEDISSKSLTGREFMQHPYQRNQLRQTVPIRWLLWKSLFQSESNLAENWGWIKQTTTSWGSQVLSHRHTAIVTKSSGHSYLHTAIATQPSMHNHCHTAIVTLLKTVRQNVVRQNAVKQNVARLNVVSRNDVTRYAVRPNAVTRNAVSRMLFHQNHHNAA